MATKCHSTSVDPSLGDHIGSGAEARQPAWQYSGARIGHGAAQRTPLPSYATRKPAASKRLTTAAKRGICRALVNEYSKISRRTFRQSRGEAFSSSSSSAPSQSSLRQASHIW